MGSTKHAAHECRFSESGSGSKDYRVVKPAILTCRLGTGTPGRQNRVGKNYKLNRILHQCMVDFSALAELTKSSFEHMV